MPDCEGCVVLEVLGWLAEHCASVRFYNLELVVGEPADAVEITVGTQTVVRPTLHEAINALREAGCR